MGCRKGCVSYLSWQISPTALSSYFYLIYINISKQRRNIALYQWYHIQNKQFQHKMFYAVYNRVSAVRRAGLGARKQQLSMRKEEKYYGG